MTIQKGGKLTFFCIQIMSKKVTLNFCEKRSQSYVLFLASIEIWVLRIIDVSSWAFWIDNIFHFICQKLVYLLFLYLWGLLMLSNLLEQFRCTTCIQVSHFQNRNQFHYAFLHEGLQFTLKEHVDHHRSMEKHMHDVGTIVLDYLNAVSTHFLFTLQCFENNWDFEKWSPKSG